MRSRDWNSACAHAAVVVAAAALTSLAAPLAAQAPETDVFLVPIVREPGGGYTFGAPRNVTARAGYDNQPAWLPDGSAFLFTSIRADGQADVYRYDLVTGRTTRVTRTTESEYSPTPIRNGRHFSTVRVERDSTQRLWSFPMGGAGEPSLLLPDVRPVGYHAWADDSTLALFVLGEPPTLQVVSISAGTAEIVASRIGRAITAVPSQRAFTYVQLDTTGRSGTIRRVSLDGMRDEVIAPFPEGNEFHSWMPDGSLVSGSGTSIYLWDAGHGAWLEIANLEGRGLRAVSRMAVSPSGDWLALVAEPAGIGIRKDP
jgi:WD40 repeat protein